LPSPRCHGGFAKALDIEGPAAQPVVPGAPTANPLLLPEQLHCQIGQSPRRVVGWFRGI